MPASAPSVAARPTVFAGFPAGSWAFAARVWLGVILALYASFWLELGAPSSAAITVAILALPTRGQGLEKAGFRVFGTVLGVAASIAIAGVFSQTGSLILVVFSISMGVCAYAAAMLDGNRAYAAALGCITIGLIAVQQIDSPLQVFPTGVDRGAAIVIGVLATGLLNDVLATPDYHPVLLSRLEALHRQVTGYIEGAVAGEIATPAVAGSLLRDITALRPEVATLATESSSGNARSAAGRAAMVDLVGELYLARALAVLPSVITDHDDNSSDLLTICRSWLNRELMRKKDDVRDDLDAMRDGVHPAHEWRAPLYRSHRIAAGSGVRAALVFALAAIFFVVTGWPATEICLTLVAVMIGLSCIAPNPRQVMMVAVLATPLACLLAGILKYFILDTLSEFQLLAIGLAPFVIGPALLITLPNLVYASFGRLTLVFTLAVLAPTNPQSYDPATFLVTCLFVCLSAVLAFAGQLLFPPLSNEARVRLLLKEARHDLDRLDLQLHPHFAPGEARFRDATRVALILSNASPASDPALDEAMRCFDQAATFRLCGAKLDTLSGGRLAETARAARAALTRRDPRALMASAEALRESASSGDEQAASACAALVLASVMFGRQPSAAQSIGKGAP